MNPHKRMTRRAISYGVLMLASAWALVGSAFLFRYAEIDATAGLFFRTHRSGFAPLYALLGAHGLHGVAWLLIASVVYSALALLYWRILPQLVAAPDHATLMWHHTHWWTLGLVWFGWVLVYPLLSDDVIYYAVQARLSWLYGTNPYLVLPNHNGSSDMWQQLLPPNQQVPFVYGPLALYLTLPSVMLNSASLTTSLILLKLLNIAQLITCGVVLWCLLDDQPQAARRHLLLALLWHPLVMLEAVWNSHNDVAMMLFVLGALLAWQRQHVVLTFALLAAAVATKHLPLLLLPLFLAALLRAVPPRAIIPRLLGAVAPFALVLATLYAPLAWGRAATLLDVFAARTTKINPSVGALIEYYGTSMLGATAARLVAPTLLLALIAGLSWRVWRGAALADAIIIVLGSYIFLANNWYVPWYGLWPLLLAPLAQPWLRQAVLLITLLLPIYYVINIVALPAWLLVLCISGLPLLLLYRAWKAQHQLARSPHRTAL